ncbi:TRAP transporter small permease [Jiella pelagia]|uniref:TRAP transporter small permease protein n=1 Tax=Jiella pelagia TaxID=2986949 RepID=A0ABY7BYW3_9HYPH|nr:TRAP transporter small permease [Jiella pelagia]WAP68603.1 TRAP transporter small permease [Jiella pelagia]
MSIDRPSVRSAEPSPPPMRDESENLSDLKIVDLPVIVLFWVLAFVVFLQFFTRYVLNDSLGWTEEIARYLLIGVTFIGAVSAVRRESHIAVELLYTRVSRQTRFALQIFVDVVSLAFYGILAWLSVHLSQCTLQKMTSIDVPKSLIYWVVAGCFAAMTIYQLLVLVRHLRTRSSRLIDVDSATSSGPSL